MLKIPPSQILKVRDTFDLTQENLATILGVSPSTVHRWEKDIGDDIGKLPYLYLHSMLNIISEKEDQIERLKQDLKKSLLIGGQLAAVYALLKCFYGDSQLGTF